MTNSVIYLIKSKNNKILDTYIGSSKDFKTRKAVHRCFYYNNCYGQSNGRKLYDYMRQNGGWDEFEFKILEEINTLNRRELTNRERHWYDIIKPTLNTYKPKKYEN